MVLNKIKAHPFDLNRRGLQQKYQVIRDFIKTDCEDGTGFEHLRKTIEHGPIVWNICVTASSKLVHDQR